jgi:hypothetical protein
MSKLAKLQKALESQKFRGEVYEIGNSQSSHDRDLVVIHTCKPEERLDSDLKMTKLLKTVFGRSTRIFRDLPFDDYTDNQLIHFLSYLVPSNVPISHILEEEFPFVVRSYFSNYSLIYGKDRGKQYHRLAETAIKKNPHVTMEYIDFAIMQIYDTALNPRIPLVLLNTLISANRYAVRVLKELKQEFNLTFFNQSDAQEITQLISKIHNKSLSTSTYSKYISQQQELARKLLRKLISAKKKF